MISVPEQARRDYLWKVLVGLAADINKIRPREERAVVAQELLDRYGWIDPRTLRGWSLQGALDLVRPHPDRPGG